MFFKELTNPGLFVFIFVLLKEFLQKIIYFSRILTQTFGVEGEHADLLTTTTTTAQLNFKC